MPIIRIKEQQDNLYIDAQLKLSSSDINLLKHRIRARSEEAYISFKWWGRLDYTISPRTESSDGIINLYYSVNGGTPQIIVVFIQGIYTRSVSFNSSQFASILSAAYRDDTTEQRPKDSCLIYTLQCQ